MSHIFIDEDVDIFKRPVLDFSHQVKAGIQITIGDLHGNAMKLMFMLVKHGIATNIDEAAYNNLVKIYAIPTKFLTRENLDEFNQILSKIEFSKDSLIRLIGDELADRGQNDYFTLKILEKLNEHQVPVEIIVSNHSIEFIEAYEKQEHFNPPMLCAVQHAPSVANLQILVDNKIVEREEILAIVNKSYKPTLRAISYSLSEDKKDITLYSHAAVGLNTIKSLAEKLKVNYKDATAHELAQTINNINVQFQKHVQNNTVNTLYTREKMFQGYEGWVELKDAPFEFIMWNRFYKNIERPAIHSGYKVNFVHGHDSKGQTQGNIFNLDNTLGKALYCSRGDYTVLYSREGEMAPAPLLVQLEKIKVKEVELRKNGHTVAADSAQTLYQTVKKQYQLFTEGTINTEDFQKKCSDAIKVARLELEKHRGWKQVLGNLALAVVGVGVFYVVAGLIHKAVTGNFLFFKTDSADKIDQLEQSIKCVNGPM